jgi:hypothetical protein
LGLYYGALGAVPTWYIVDWLLGSRSFAIAVALAVLLGFIARFERMNVSIEQNVITIVNPFSRWTVNIADWDGAIYAWSIFPGVAAAVVRVGREPTISPVRIMGLPAPDAALVLTTGGPESS